MNIWSFLLLLGLSIGCLLAARKLFHWFQLESYQFPGYFRTLGRNFLKAVLPGVLMDFVLIGGSLLIAEIIKEDIPSRIVLAVLLIAAGFLIRLLLCRKAEKKPFRYTPRVKRLYGTAFLVFLGLLILFTYAGGGIEGGTLFLLTLLFPLFLPLWVALAGLLAWPLEKLISELYFRDAQRILREHESLIRIGITGSWGKTSVKFILGTLLNEKYNTLITPASFNTPMGVTRIIREKLEPGHRVFVAEMGARHVGDIKEMCRLVHPSIGLLTSVGPQHLDTFRTVERVAKTKYELIDAIPADGSCFFADDGEDGIVRGLYRKTEKDKSLSGLDRDTDDVWAEEIRVGAEGSSFLLCTRSERIPCETVLLGELNIRNILLCAAVCLKLGMTGKEIARGVRKLQPVEHRLQLTVKPGGIHVIDDAFNSNIRGAVQAFRVLKEFPGKRIVVTPGMVELGDQEEAMNREFGKAMADCCDLAILVGRKRSEEIRKGLTEGGFRDENIRTVADLNEAAELLRTEAAAGDTVLFENDLPDNYEG